MGENYAQTYVVGSKSFQPDKQKPCQLENAERDIHVQYFLKGIELLVHRCEKCVEIQGYCTEKQQSCFTLTLSSPMMPFGIILLILFFICYNFWGLERVNPCSSFWDGNG
jgi:hypothetical protein